MAGERDAGGRLSSRGGAFSRRDLGSPGAPSLGPDLTLTSLTLSLTLSPSLHPPSSYPSNHPHVSLTLQ